MHVGYHGALQWSQMFKHGAIRNSVVVYKTNTCLPIACKQISFLQKASEKRQPGSVYIHYLVPGNPCIFRLQHPPVLEQDFELKRRVFLEPAQQGKKQDRRTSPGCIMSDKQYFHGIPDRSVLSIQIPHELPGCTDSRLDFRAWN